MSARDPYQAIAIGGSAGGLSVLIDLLEPLPAAYDLPILVCLHVHPDDGGQLVELLSGILAMPVREATDKEPILPGHVYVAPADYHLLVERTFTLALSRDPKVFYCRPSIDVLFESAARAYSSKLLGVLLTGANSDGTAGLAYIRSAGGLTVAQDPKTAESPVMPQAAIDRGAAKHVLSPGDIRALMLDINGNTLLAKRSETHGNGVQRI